MRATKILAGAIQVATEASVFKARDIRGVYGPELNEASFRKLGGVLQPEELALGSDYREHSDSLSMAVREGYHGRLRFLGHAPTPMVCYLSRIMGIAITASHLPADQNGAKLFKEQRVFLKEELEALRSAYEKSTTDYVSTKASALELEENLRLEYLSRIPHIEHGIFDLAGGAACSIKEIFPKVIYETPDPLFSEHGPEPNHGTLTDLEKRTKMDGKVGFAFDGDADRCVLVVDGKVMRGDFVAAFVAKRFLGKGDTIVFTCDCSREVDQYCNDLGIRTVYAPVGQPDLIKTAMANNASLTAEPFSGHFAFTDFMLYCDAIYFAAKISAFKPSEFLEFQSQFKHVLRTFSLLGRRSTKRLEDEMGREVDEPMIRIDGVKILGPDYGVHVRPSKTEPVTRITIEAIDSGALKRLTKKVKELL